MKTGVDLVCQREQNSHSRDFLRKLPVLEMSSSHAYPLYFYCIQEHLQSFNTQLFFQLPFCNLKWYKYYIKWFTVCIFPSIFYLFQCIQTFFMKDNIFKEDKVGEYCQKTLCLPWCLLTWKYLSMHFNHGFVSVFPSTEFGFYFSPQQTDWGCKAACQAKNMKWAKVFKLGIWPWSLTSWQKVS